MLNILRQVQGWVKIKGDSDGTKVGNVGDSIKANVTASALPSGASTEAKQDSSITQQTSTNTKLDTLNAKDFATQTTLAALEAKASTEAKQDTQITNQNTLNTRTGDLTETAPATDTASSGLNGRLQRIAQRITDLITTVTTGTGILSTIRGNTDGTLIGNIDDKLKVVTSPIDPGDFITFKSDTQVVLSSDVTYDTLHSVTGSGVFVGATFVGDNTGIEWVIEIDGNEIFNFTGDFLQEVINQDSDYKASGIFSASGDGKKVYCTPATPFNYKTSLVFKARLAGKKVKYQLYTYSEM